MDRMRTSARDPHLVLTPNPRTSGVVLLMVDDDRIAFALPELGKMKDEPWSNAVGLFRATVIYVRIVPIGA